MTKSVRKSRVFKFLNRVFLFLILLIDFKFMKNMYCCSLTQCATSFQNMFSVRGILTCECTRQHFDFTSDKLTTRDCTHTRTQSRHKTMRMRQMWNKLNPCSHDLSQHSDACVLPCMARNYPNSTCRSCRHSHTLQKRFFLNYNLLKPAPCSEKRKKISFKKQWLEYQYCYDTFLCNLDYFWWKSWTPTYSGNLTEYNFHKPSLKGQPSAVSHDMLSDNEFRMFDKYQRLMTKWRGWNSCSRERYWRLVPIPSGMK